MIFGDMQAHFRRNTKKDSYGCNSLTVPRIVKERIEEFRKADSNGVPNK